ncbi:MAG TPA: EAL domain-containing protein [Nocardioidaceae bacterium]|nr:EAL domain-containing protein [Nocardioidaceae bacterium]
MTDTELETPDLIKAVADLSRTATGQFAVNDLLRHLVDLAADHLSADGAGVMVADGACLMFVHGSSTGIGAVERLQELMQHGPCQEAMRDLREVTVGDLADPSLPSEWAPYRAEAERAGLQAVVAVPLVSRGRGWGVLDLYRREPGPWSPADIAAARLLADVAVSYVVMAADRDEARHAQRELAHRSTHDELTGLPNRALLFDRLEHALTAAARHEQAVAVFFIDLDRFKQINDTFGHAGGDKVLVEATARMAQTLRTEDTLARLSGDEFVVVVEQLPRQAGSEFEEHLDAVAQRVRSALSTPVRIGGVDLVVTASIGVAVSDSQSTGDDLVSEADAAMYRAKQRRQGELVIRAHNPGLGRRSSRHLDRELADALSGGQLRVHYQPIVSADDLRVFAVEALLRWEHPTHGLLPAADFIAVAESTGLVAPIGRWLIDSVCAQLRSWHDQLNGQAPPTAYVNLSARELADPRLADILHASLQRHGLQPQHLGLELLEACFIDPHLVPVLLSLHARGHPLSVDDFGTGYSSLSRLIQLPVGTAKIDRSVATALEHDPRSRALVDAVLVVASKLDLQVIGEGVENSEQARYLREAGCPLLQGYHFGPPQTARELTAHWTQ